MAPMKPSKPLSTRASKSTTLPPNLKPTSVNEADVDDTLTSDDNDDSTVQDSQNSAETTSPPAHGLQTLMSKMVDAQRARHSTRKSAALRTYASSKASTAASITTLFNAHDEALVQSHTKALAHLASLTQRKRELEAAVQGKVDRLRAEYLRMSKVLAKVVEYKMQGMG